MSDIQKNVIDFIVASISEFAEAHRIPMKEAFFYLEKYAGIRFLTEFYDVEHTLSFGEIVSDLTKICSRKGGKLV